MTATRLKHFVKTIPVLGELARSVSHAFRPRFPGSASYWEDRYRKGGHSGAGSYDRLAEFKAEVLNEFVAENGIQSVIEFGSGDGNQLRLADYPRYLGIDVSASAVERCRTMFAVDKTKTFQTLQEFSGGRADLTLSLDVIYHLVEDPVYESHMRSLFDSADRFVGIYASNDGVINQRLGGGRDQGLTHERHRRFTDWIDANAPGWKLAKHIPNRYPFDPNSPANTSLAEFFFYEKA